MSDRRANSGRRRILFVMTGIYFDPHQTVARRKLEALSSRFSGHVFAVLHSRAHKGLRIGEFTVEGVYLPAAIRNSRLLRSLCYLAYIFVRGWSLHRRRGLDVIVVKDAFKTGAVALLLKRVIGCRLIVDVLGNHVKALEYSGARMTWSDRVRLAVVKWFSPRVLRSADAVKLLYPGQLSDLGMEEERLERAIFHEFVPVHLFSPTAYEEPPYVLFAGGPWYLKGLDLLIESFFRIAEEFPQLRLKAVGYTPDRERFEELRRGHPRIDLGAQVPYQRIIELMQGCRVFVLPSRTEAMGSVLLEAMAAGKPVIASRVDGIPTYVEDGRTGLLFEPGDVADLTRKLKEVLSDPALAAELGKQACRSVHERFSEDEYVESFGRLVERALGAKGEGAVEEGRQRPPV